jgi:hypothetical protein
MHQFQAHMPGAAHLHPSYLPMQLEPVPPLRAHTHTNTTQQVQGQWHHAYDMRTQHALRANIAPGIDTHLHVCCAHPTHADHSC